MRLRYPIYPRFHTRIINPSAQRSLGQPTHTTPNSSPAATRHQHSPGSGPSFPHPNPLESACCAGTRRQIPTGGYLSVPLRRDSYSRDAPKTPLTTAIHAYGVQDPGSQGPSHLHHHHHLGPPRKGKRRVPAAHIAAADRPATVASHGLCCADELVEEFVEKSRLFPFDKVFNCGVTSCQLWLLMRLL